MFGTVLRHTILGNDILIRSYYLLKRVRVLKLLPAPLLPLSTDQDSGPCINWKLSYSRPSVPYTDTLFTRDHCGSGNVRH